MCSKSYYFLSGQLGDENNLYSFQEYRQSTNLKKKHIFGPEVEIWVQMIQDYFVIWYSQERADKLMLFSLQNKKLIGELRENFKMMKGFEEFEAEKMFPLMEETKTVIVKKQ